MCLFRNKDFQEVTLEKDGKTVLRFAAAYGFRNIQNMVLKLKKGKCYYHFIEVLACPGGNDNTSKLGFFMQEFKPRSIIPKDYTKL